MIKYSNVYYQSYGVSNFNALNSGINTNVHSINITWRTMEKIKTICFLVDDYNLDILIIIKNF